MAYDFAKIGQTLHGYTEDVSLGYQQIKPLRLDALAVRLKPYAIKWEYIKFIESNKDSVPTISGVYFFIVHPHSANIHFHSIILYFGQARNLRDRFGDYIVERDEVSGTGREHIKKMLNVYRNRVHFAYCPIDRYELDKVEDLLVDAFRPCCNIQPAQPAF